MGQDNYEISTATKEELKIITDMAVKEGWTESYDTIDAIYDIDPNGYFVGKIDGKIISSISAVRYPDNYGFIGFYIVLPEYRGKGYGLKIFQHAMKHLSGCIVCLDAVQQEVETYKRGGFVSSEETYRIIGTAVKSEHNEHVKKYDEDQHFNLVCEYDKGCLPSQRNDFLRNWMKVPNAKSVVYIDDNGKFCGYSSIHRTCHGWEISPCYADNKEIAKALIQELINSLDEGAPIGLNIPSNHKDALDLVDEITDTYKLSKKFACVRMYANGRPTDLQTKKFFSLLSLSVG